MYDRFQAIAREAQLAVVILADPSANDIELVDVTTPNPEHLDALAASGRRLEFLGVVGLVNGVPRTALAAPLDMTRLEALAVAFCRHCEGKLDAQIAEHRMGDSLDWLSALYKLPDTRPN